MAIYHCSIKIISRGKGKSAVAAAAYRAGQKITDEFDGEIHDYTRKSGVVHTEILLPAQAPAAYQDRAVLWNAVEKIEKAKNAQLARELELALPRELTREQGISLVREYVKRHFVAAGMCADFAIHDTGGGNPHAHIMLTMRPIEQGGAWGAKQKKEYILDPQGKKIYDPKKRQYKCRSVPATDWNEQTKAEEWRAAWAEICNQVLEQNGHAERIDHRSYERQGIDQIPTVHLGVAASAMEKRGIRTERGDLNREIEITNQKLRQLKARIGKLREWLKEEAANTEPLTLADYIQGILTRKAQAGKSGYSQLLYNLKDAAKMLNFLQANHIMDMAGLDEKFSSMIGEQLDIQGKLKPVERRLDTLKKHIGQADIYFKYKGKKPLTETEQILFTAAKDYLKGVMSSKTAIPTKAWKTEYAKLTAEKKTLNQRYLTLKEEVKEAEQIRKSVYSILRQEQREHAPRRTQDIER
ncbi:MAG: MobA/MobL family protein [Clostridiaceae bacterium]|uniref:MobQ family relaxase n=1 Tax=Flavonifractor plautii TaxID=292800 RepID=UPI000B394F39|nr:MobQ family relaxase [Flavonifractor plautii]MBS7226294.1 MobA/MobL family protein [Clostridiaceae bacterium]OUO82612.1 MobA/MobL family protein [Flavonifractor plautii]